MTDQSDDDNDDSPAEVLEVGNPYTIPGQMREGLIDDPKDSVRKWLALGLASIFAFEVILCLLYIVSGNCDNIQAKVAAVKEFSEIFLSPTIALVGAATGFYFGEKK